MSNLNAKSAAAIAISIVCILPIESAFAFERMQTAAAATPTKMVLISEKPQKKQAIAPGRTKPAPQNQSLKAARGNSATVCCTIWRSDHTFDGCATYEGACPSGTFTQY